MHPDRRRAWPFATAALATLGLLGAPGCGGEDSPPALLGPPVESTLAGALTYERVPHAGDGRGLDYGAVITAPIRAARVELVGADGAALAEAFAGDDGGYRLEFTGPVRARLRVYAETSEPPLTVQDNTAGDAVFSVESAELTLSGEATLDLAATTGWGGEAYTGPRAAAPFAILDSALTAAQRFLAEASPPPAFPPLAIHWSPENRPEEGALAEGLIGTSHWDGADLYILGRDGVDTDEFDADVIIHEWGHYYESRISRADSPGGPHGYGDLLDPRVALSEGFCNALSAIILEPDTIYSDAMGPAQADGFSWDLEENDISPAAMPGWYSEPTVEAIVFDLYDAQPEAFDQVALGLGPIHEVLAGEVRGTPALTTIFPFVAGLKASRPAEAQAIDALVSHHRADVARGIDAVADAWGAGETHTGGLTGSLPIYVDGAIGAPVSLGLTGGGDYNALGQNRYVRVTGAGAPLTIRSSCTQDVDLFVYRRGEVIQLASTSSGDEELSFPAEAGEPYIINVQGYGLVAGDYPVTLDVQKTGAPVAITAAPGPTGAQVAIAFRADAADVSISVWGADGLEMEGSRAPVSGRSFRAGSRLGLQVGYAAPRAAATLAVQVSGTFGSRRLSAVRSFTVGDGSPPAQSGAAGELSTDSRGRPIRVMRP